MCIYFVPISKPTLFSLVWNAIIIIYKFCFCTLLYSMQHYHTILISKSIFDMWQGKIPSLLYKFFQGLILCFLFQVNFRYSISDPSKTSYWYFYWDALTFFVDNISTNNCSFLFYYLFSLAALARIFSTILNRNVNIAATLVLFLSIFKNVFPISSLNTMHSIEFFFVIEATKFPLFRLRKFSYTTNC